MKVGLSLPFRKRLGRQASTYAHSRYGLTLIEILMATVLAAWMMSSMVGVVRRLEHQRHVLIPASDGIWLQNLADQLRRDLNNARSIVMLPDGWTLYGYGSRNWETGEPQLRPAKVIYRIESRGTIQVLIREELELNRLNNSEYHRELVAVGVKALRLGGLEESAEAISQHAPENSGLVATPIPTRMRIVVVNSAGRIVVNSILLQARN